MVVDPFRGSTGIMHVVGRSRLGVLCPGTFGHRFPTGVLRILYSLLYCMIRFLSHNTSTSRVLVPLQAVIVSL